MTEDEPQEPWRSWKAGATRSGAEATRHEPWRSWVGQHQAWLLAGVPVVVAIFSVMSAAHYDPYVAMTIFQQSNTVAIVASSLIFGADVLLLAAALTLWLAQPNPFGVSYWTHVAVNFVAGLALISVLPWRFVAAMVSLVGVYYFVVPEPTARRWNAVLRAIWPRIFAATTVLMLILRLTVFDFVWVTPEMVMHTGRQKTVGYVLSDDGRWTTVLRERDRRLHILPSGTVYGRVPCALPTTGNPLGYMLETPSLISSIRGERDPEPPICAE